MSNLQTGENGKSFSLGIDLGTTNSCCAVLPEGSTRPQVVKDVAGNRLVPSVVQFLPTGILVGQPAIEKQTQQPGTVVYDSKRIIGSTHNIALNMKKQCSWPFDLAEGKTKEGCQITEIIMEFGQKKIKFLPEEIAAFILRHMKETAEAMMNSKNCTSVTICVSANYTILQKEAVRVAAILAGFAEATVVIMNEPAAAALAYGCNLHAPSAKEILVYDLGGGTLDITVLTLRDGRFDVLATGGCQNFGGRDIDHRMKNNFEKEFAKLHPGVRLNERQKQKVLAGCENAKKKLAALPEWTVVLEEVIQNQQNPVLPKEDFQYTFKRTEFELDNMPFFLRTIEIMEMVIKDAKRKKSDITDVILVGGSTRIPKIKELLSEFFGKKIAQKVDADEAVAIGAAINAGLIAKRQLGINDKTRFFDVAPNHIGIKLYDGSMSVFIRKDRKLPAPDIPRNYTTAVDNQAIISISVYEGMKSLADDNILIGHFCLDDVPPRPKGQTNILVSVGMTKEGFLHGTARVIGTGLKGTRKMEIKKKVSARLLALLQKKFEDIWRNPQSQGLKRKREEEEYRNHDKLSAEGSQNQNHEAHPFILVSDDYENDSVSDESETKDVEIVTLSSDEDDDKNEN